MTSARAFRQAVVGRLRYLIDLRGKSVAAVEKEMGRGRGYIGDALRGEKRISLEVLLEVLEHLRVEPEAFFSGKTPEEARWDLGQSSTEAKEIADSKVTSELLRKLGKRASASGDPLLEDVSALLELLTRALESRGLLSPDEIEEALSGAEKKKKG